MKYIKKFESITSTGIGIDELKDNVDYIMQSLLDDYHGITLDISAVSTVFDNNNDFKRIPSKRYKSSNDFFGREYPPVQLSLGIKNAVLVILPRNVNIDVSRFLHHKEDAIYALDMKVRYIFTNGNRYLLFWSKVPLVKESNNFNESTLVKTDLIKLESEVRDFLQEIADDFMVKVDIVPSYYNKYTNSIMSQSTLIDRGYNSILATFGRPENISFTKFYNLVSEYIISKKYILDILNVYADVRDKDMLSRYVRIIFILKK